MKLSVFSACMPEYDIGQTIRILRETGYDGVEWRVNHPAPGRQPDGYTYERRYWDYNKSTVDVGRIEDQIGAVSAACARSGLEICSLTSYAGLWDVDVIGAVMKAAASIGCKNIRVNVPRYGGSVHYRVLFEKTFLQLRELDRLFAGSPVRINLETHYGTVMPGASAAIRLLGGLDPGRFGVIYDPGNMMYEGYEDFRMGLEMLGEYVAHVHIKNSRWVPAGTNENGDELWKPSSARINRGFLDIPELVRTLLDVGYDGYLSVEDFSNDLDTLEKIREDYGYLRKVLDRLERKNGAEPK